MGPIILGLLAAGGIYAALKFRGGGFGGFGTSGIPAATAGTVPLISGGGVPSTVVGPSGAVYTVIVYPVDATGNKAVTAQWVGVSKDGQLSQVNQPLSWVSYKQSVASGKLSGLRRGSEASATMLADFGLNNVAA